MKFLILCIFMFVAAMTPLFLFQNMVMPELLSLQAGYESIDETAARAAAVEQ